MFTKAREKKSRFKQEVSAPMGRRRQRENRVNEDAVVIPPGSDRPVPWLGRHFFGFMLSVFALSIGAMVAAMVA